MSALTFIPYQYRSFEGTYVFKLNTEGDLTLKILNISQQCLFKKKFSSQELSSIEVKQKLNEGNFSFLFENLIAKSSLPKNHQIPPTSKITLSSCQECLDETIEQFKPHVLVDRKELENLTCPITFEVFKDPVIDEHGHTFEKSAIEEHLRNSNQCPMNRQPIHSLTPNLLVKATIEEWQKKDPIPNFSIFQRDNPRLAQMNLKMAQTCVEEKEYKEALELYARSFQYTKNWEDYASLPYLFEAMGEHQKATLAYLYLAKYQLQGQKTHEATKTLETIQQGKIQYLQANLVLIKLYRQTQQPQKALTLGIKTAEAFAQNSPEQAIFLYKQLLREHPFEFSLYSRLANLIKLPEEHRHILLKGTLEALQQGNYQVAKDLIQQAENSPQKSFIDSLISLDLLKKQGNLSQVKQKLLDSAQSFERQGLTREKLSTYKMLLQLEKKPEYCQKIASAYQILQKPHKALHWSTTQLSLLIKEEEWEQGETLAKHILQKSENLQQKITLYENLEEIYTNWQGHKLQDLWPQLGKSYQDNHQLAAAEKTYRKAFEKFHRFEEAIALAEVLKTAGKTQESVHTYYEAAIEALLEQNSDRLSLCTKEIKQIDPHLQHLDLNQRMHLLTKEHFLKLQSENERLSSKLTPLEEKVQLLEKENTSLKDRVKSLEEGTNQSLGHVGTRLNTLESDLKKTKEVEKTSQQRISSLETVVQPLKEKAIQEEKRRIAEEQERVRQAELERKQREELSEIAFGKAKWQKYFGDIGTEPPLPKDIDQILKSPCPYWSGKRIEETHLLVLVPSAVNGKAFTLNTLQELIKSPKTGNKTQYRGYSDYVKKELGDKNQTAHWVLMTRDVIPDSRSKTYGDQKSLVASHAQRTKIPYELPTALEAATAILMEHVQTGNRIYSDDPNTYTRCQEKVNNNQWPVAIGGFSSGGLNVDLRWLDSNLGVGCCRKL